MIVHCLCVLVHLYPKHAIVGLSETVLSIKSAFFVCPALSGCLVVVVVYDVALSFAPLLTNGVYV